MTQLATQRASRRARPVAVAAAALAMTLSVSACSAGTPSDAESGGVTELTFVYFGDPEQSEGYQPLFDAFNEQNPDIKLNAEGVPATSWGDFLNTVATRIAGGEKFDVIQVATEGQRLLVDKDLLEPLTEYIERDQDIVDDYYSDISQNIIDWNVEYASTDGQVYYVPGQYNTMGMYLNKELFAEAGVPIPTDGWTWDEFVDAGKKIKAATGAYLYDVQSAGQFVHISPWLMTNDANTFNDTWTEATFNSPQAVETAEFLRTLVEEGLSPQPGGEYEADVQFAQGNLAVLSGGRWPVAQVRRLDFVEQTEAVQWPYNVAPGSPAGWDAYPIFKASEHKDEAWEFIKFLMSEEAGEFFASNPDSPAFPARISAATSPAFVDPAPVGVERLVEALETATPVPAPNRGPEAEAIITEAWLSIVTGNRDAQSALDEANEKLNALL